MADRPEVNFEDTDLRVIVGDDPCVVCLHDASINRTVAPNQWYWDFGDKFTYCGFELPGDDVLVNSLDTGKQESLISMLNIIGNTNLAMCPTYPGSYGTPGRDTVHYTGIYIRASDTATDAAITELPTASPAVYREAGTENTPVRRTGINVPAESCGKTRKTADNYTHNTCGGQDIWGNGVYHIYKGAGVYPVYMSSWTRAGGLYDIVNRVGYTPMQNENVPSDDRVVNYGIVVVKPRCPCFFDFEPVTSGDTESRCIGITNPNYSCRDDSTLVSNSTGYLEPVDEDGLLSAYAPFMRIGVNGKIRPMSFPIDKIYWDWCDWFTDFSDADTVTDIVIDGTPRGWDHHWLGSEQSHFDVQGSHTYTMPGLYSLYFDYEYLTAAKGGDTHDYSDVASAIELLSMFIEDDCPNTPVLRDKFMLVEIPPRFTGSIDIGNRTENEKGTELTVEGITVKNVLRPGSYPIERIDWDFGDGTPIFTLYKNDYIESLNAASAWDFSDEYTSGVHSLQGYTYTFLNGYNTNQVYEPFVEDYTLRHVYRRTNVDTGYTYTISCTAYAENTHTSASASIVIEGFETPYPSFDEVEGEVRVVDTRNYGSSDDTIIVFNGSNSGELYHVKVEDK